MADNSQFVSCGEDKAAFLWDVSTGAVVRRMQGHEQRINACCFSTEGSVLFTASYDKVRRGEARRGEGRQCKARQDKGRPPWACLPLFVNRDTQVFCHVQHRAKLHAAVHRATRQLL